VCEEPALKERRHIPALDGLRGLAVIIVFFFHYAGGAHSSLRAVRIFGFINKAGWSGVTLFFILSGFLITGILWDSFDQPHWWRNFYVRRTLRIFPLYYVSIVLVVLAAAWKGTLRQACDLIWIPVLFLQNMPHLNALVDRIPSSLGLFHFWSLGVEEQFYLIWPFLLVIQKSRNRAQNLCVAIFVFACLFRILIWNFAPNPDDFSEFLITRSGELAAGGWLALAYRGPAWSRIQRFAPVATLVGFAGFLTSGIFAGSLVASGRIVMAFGLPCITLGFVGLLVLAMRPGIVQRCAEASLLRWLGGISYGIYVFHMLFLNTFISIEEKLFGHHGHGVTTAGLFLVAAVGSVGMAWISFHFFETPFLTLKNRFTTRSGRPVLEASR
jgi:peptidoglycan/LPS O-acetylase OafA/YrhL